MPTRSHHSYRANASLRPRARDQMNLRRAVGREILHDRDEVLAHQHLREANQERRGIGQLGAVEKGVHDVQQRNCA